MLQCLGRGNAIVFTCNVQAMPASVNLAPGALVRLTSILVVVVTMGTLDRQVVRRALDEGYDVRCLLMGWFTQLLKLIVPQKDILFNLIYSSTPAQYPLCFFSTFILFCLLWIEVIIEFCVIFLLWNVAGQNWGQAADLRYDCCFICVDASLSALDQYVNRRVDLMVSAGLLEEVCDIYKPNTDYTWGLWQAISVHEIEDFLSYSNSEYHKMFKESVHQILDFSVEDRPKLILE